LLTVLVVRKERAEPGLEERAEPGLEERAEPGLEERAEPGLDTEPAEDAASWR